jgi:hypothetical protein
MEQGPACAYVGKRVSLSGSQQAGDTLALNQALKVIYGSLKTIKSM